MAGLGLLAGELGVDRLVRERARLGMVDPAQEVGDTPDALVHERHLEHDVVALGQHVADPVDPLLERLVVGPVTLGHLVHRQPLGPIPGEDRLLVFETLVEQHLRHLAERTRLDGARARLDLVLQREEMGAVEPRRDLRRGEEPFRHHPIMTDGCGVQIRHQAMPAATLGPMGSIVMLCTDGSDFAIEALRTSLPLLASADRTVLMTVETPVDPVVETGTGFTLERSSTDRSEQIETSGDRLAKSHLDRTADALGLDDVELRAVVGTPGTAICELAASLPASVVVIGTSGRGGVRRAIIGSTSDYVIRHAHCPVLVHAVGHR